MIKDIVDAHHHLWRLSDVPWLNGPSVPRAFGSYDPIKRDYLIEEYLRELQPHGVSKSIYVQVNWPVDQYEEEVKWVSSVVEQSGWPHGMVSYAHLTEGDVRPQLDRLARYPLVRGVRQQLHWHENPLYRFAPVCDQHNEEIFRRNLGALADYGYSFDLQLFSGQMADGARLVADFPSVNFILVHAGMHEDTTVEGAMAWKEGMRALAAHPNVYVKLSGLGMFIHRNDPSHIKAIVSTCVDMFGAKRCMFGSNFPVESMWTAFSPLLQAYTDALASLSEEAQNAVFRETATKVYRL